VADRDGLAGADDVGRQRGVVVGGREDAHLVAAGDEVLGKVPHVQLHATGHVEGVGADQADPHPTTSPAGTKTRCIMCQSSVCSRTAAARKSAHCWVRSRTCSCRVPGAASRAGPKVMTIMYDAGPGGRSG